MTRWYCLDTSLQDNCHHILQQFAQASEWHLQSAGAPARLQTRDWRSSSVHDWKHLYYLREGIWVLYILTWPPAVSLKHTLQAAFLAFVWVSKVRRSLLFVGPSKLENSKLQTASSMAFDFHGLSNWDHQQLMLWTPTVFIPCPLYNATLT